MIQVASAPDYASLARIWERAVKATHDFLKPEDFAYYRDRIQREYFPQVRLWKYTDTDGSVRGFIGLSDMVEMLFVDPEYFGRGIGSALLDFAVGRCAMTRVDVNEQNAAALRFYISGHQQKPVFNRILSSAYTGKI